ncbi:MAG: primosomal replication protein N [Proteobacteria bacterium]|nr:primosomal replication protein N [Pseudomonadota bacterium]
MTADNRVAIAATLVERAALRYTPAGIPAIEMTLRHRSRQAEAGGERDVECELFAVAFGEVASAVAEVAPGSPLRCHGFIARRYRTGTSLALHLTRFESTDI